MMKDEQSMFYKLRSMVHNIVDLDYFKSEDEWNDITDFTQKPEFRFLMGHLPCMVSIFNLQKGYYEFISSNMKSILGYDSKEFEGEKGMNIIFEVVLKEHQEIFLNISTEIISYIFEQSATTNAKDFRFTACMKLNAKNGLSQWYLMDTNILQVNASGQPVRTIFTITNVDALKKDDAIYYDILKRNAEGIYKPVLQKSISQSGPIQSLTEREYEILSFISKGQTSKQIADELFLSLFTVQTHRKNIKRKLNSKSNGEMINYALARGIV
jgi:DNA-binding CsgD family transcriptional regulator